MWWGFEVDLWLSSLLRDPHPPFREPPPTAPGIDLTSHKEVMASLSLYVSYKPFLMINLIFFIRYSHSS